MLTELQDVISFCGADQENDTKIVKEIQNGVEKWVKNYCRNDFEETTYTEFYSGNGNEYIHLKHFPVISLTRLAIGRRTAIRIKNTSSYTSATVSVSSTGLTLTKDGTSNSTITFAISTTMSAIVSAINALGSGWYAEIDNSDFNSYQSTELIEMYGKSAIDSTWVYLDMPYLGANDFEVYTSRGEIFRYGGWPSGYRNIYVKYSAGYSEIPDDLQLAVKIAVKYIFQKKDDENFGVKAYSLGDISITFKDDEEVPIETKKDIRLLQENISMRGPKVNLILKRKTETTDGMGGYTETWATIKTIKGVLCNVSGNERFSADKMTVISTHNFYMDYESNITEEDKLTYGTRTFQINWINNIGGNQNIALKINLLEEV